MQPEKPNETWSLNKTFAVLMGVVLVFLSLKGFYTKATGGLEVKTVYLTIYTLVGLLYIWAGTYGSREAAIWANRMIGWFFILLTGFQILTYPSFITLTKSMKIHISVGIISLFIGRYGTKIRRLGTSAFDANNWPFGK